MARESAGVTAGPCSPERAASTASGRDGRLFAYFTSRAAPRNASHAASTWRSVV